jgi:inhibitor of Bruton tyrosine kinase
LFEMDEERLADESTASLCTSPDGENEAALDSASTLPHQYHGLNLRESLASSKSEGCAALSVGASLQVGSVSSTVLEKNSEDAIQSPACPEIYSKVWHGPLAGSAKADFKDIMAQASASRTSNLTLAINNKDTQLGKAPQKLSQRERKKMQRQQSRERVSSPSSGVLAGSASSLPQSSPRSPWQTIQRTSALSAPQIKGPHESATPLSSRPAMTMRQTLAGAPAGPKAGKSAKPEPHPRSVPTPITGQSPNPLAQVQSIRHTPTTPAVSNSPSGAHHSMADILAQQQGEKTAIRQATAKRSLQEIQQEQEFQEWWDSESRRVQEEEQASTTSTAIVSNRGRGRGRRRKGDSHVGGRSSGIEIDARIVHADAPSRAHDGVGGTSQRTGGGQRGERRHSRGH